MEASKARASVAMATTTSGRLLRLAAKLPAVAGAGRGKVGERWGARRRERTVRFSMYAMAGATGSPDAFVRLERAISDSSSASGDPQGQSGWEFVEGCWVHRPQGCEARAVAHFCGGAFAGASPQVTYRHFLETLSGYGFVVIATPFDTNFDHLRIAEQAKDKFARCIEACDEDTRSLPVFGIGHSLGSLVQLLMCSRFSQDAGRRTGNVFISFNNKPVTDAIPFFSQLVSPAASTLVPLLDLLSRSPQAQLAGDLIAELRKQTPEDLKQLFPIVDQLQPIYEDISIGRLEFTPSPEESRRIVQKGYTVDSNLLIKFQGDAIDETPQLAAVLQSDVARLANADLALRTLSGDHITPLRQRIDPEDMPFTQPFPVDERMEAQGREFLGALAGLAQAASSSVPRGIPFSDIGGDIAKGLQDIADGGVPSLQDLAETERVAEEIALWAGLKQRELPRLPAKET